MWPTAAIWFFQAEHTQSKNDLKILFDPHLNISAASHKDELQ